MILRDNYEESHIRDLQHESRKDPQLIERALYALGLLEGLSHTGLKFIFKGGSSLMLLLPEIRRLSTDVDIVVEPGTDIRKYIEMAADIFPFVRYEEQIRIGKNDIEKRHFKFTYFSPVRRSEFYILLDVLFEENNYEELVEKEIANDLLLTGGKNAVVTLPSIDCILGDKFTAFAPNTVGVPLHANKDMEVMKQYYDISTLLEEFQSFDHVRKTYQKIVQAEIKYRGLTITCQETLIDTIQAAISIGSRGTHAPNDYAAYIEGIRGVATHVYEERFTGEIASYRAANIIYMAACLLAGTAYEQIEDEKEYIKEPLTRSELKPLLKMRKVQPLQYAYIVKADRLLNDIL